MEANLYSRVFVLLVVSGFVYGEQPLVPCYFIFGDSLVDSGNNNNLQTSAKVNYHPYGIDFPKGPTGRFSNGRTIVDIIAERLGFENFIPSFASANGSEILKGVNYASGGSGILDDTGKNLGEHIGLNKQLEHHGTTMSRIANILGSNESANELLNKCLYSVYIGSNDYINNYFMPKFFNTSNIYTPRQYAQLLIQQYSQQLRTLYKDGARKISVAGVGAIGCTPNAVATFGTNGTLCVDKMNNAAGIFTEMLKSLVDQLNHDLPDAKFILINSLKISSPPDNSKGKVNSTTACCPTAEDGRCDSKKAPCNERNLYLFWDAFHPTEIANMILADRSYNNLDQSEMYPMDIRRLTQL